MVWCSAGAPKDAPIRLLWLAGGTFANLPSDLALELRYYLPRWLKEHLPRLYRDNRARALAVFDGVCVPYPSTSAELTRSSIGNAIVSGVEQRQSPVSIGKAINSPVGVLAESLWLLLPTKASQKRKMPVAIGERLQRLFNVPGDGGGHAVCVVAQHMGWIDYCYNAWGRHVVLPFFNLEHRHSEAAWHGIMRDHNGLTPSTFAALKAAFLGILSGDTPWKLDKSEHRVQIQRLVHLTRPATGRQSYLSFTEAREALVEVDDQGRADAIWTLGSILKQGTSEREWTSFVKPFLDKAWPRQMRFRTDTVARGFARLAECSGESFESAVSTILPFLRPVSHLDMITYRIAKEEKNGQQNFASRFPAATLKLLDALIADDRSQMPHELGTVLRVIAEADPSQRVSKAWRRLNELGG